MIDVGKISIAISGFLAPLKKANWKVIMLCFSTAATFWFFNALNKVYTTLVDYPVELVFDKDSLVALKDPPEEIPINVTGGGWQLLKSTISANTEPVLIRPENPVQTQFFTATNLLPIFSSQLKDININYIAIDTIYFNIEPFAERKLCIKLDSTSVHLKENFHITSGLFVEPDSANFHGPRSLIDQLPEVFLVSLSDKNLNGNYDEELSLDLFSPSLIKKDPEVIHVKFDIEEFVDQSTDLNIEMVNFPYDSSIYILENSLQASFKVQKSFRNKLKPEDFLIIADLNDMHAADSTITIEMMDIPNYVKDINFKKNRVKVIYAN
ncbi:MAG: hypothetical protein MI975_23570 [Cytophagales bacterium]|nr:hypothetical protein [Cytophagales bacterium]